MAVLIIMLILWNGHNRHVIEKDPLCHQLIKLTLRLIEQKFRLSRQRFELTLQLIERLFRLCRLIGRLFRLCRLIEQLFRFMPINRTPISINRLHNLNWKLFDQSKLQWLYRQPIVRNYYHSFSIIPRLIRKSVFFFYLFILFYFIIPSSCHTQKNSKCIFANFHSSFPV